MHNQSMEDGSEEAIDIESFEGIEGLGMQSLLHWAIGQLPWESLSFN